MNVLSSLISESYVLDYDLLTFLEPGTFYALLEVPQFKKRELVYYCLLYTSDAADE